MDQRVNDDIVLERTGRGAAPLDTQTPLPGQIEPPARRERFTLSPINQRRWASFRANGRGYWSLWLFLILFFFTLGAEFIANDKPLVASYQDELYFPVFKAYPETAFGGDFETEAEYRDPFVQELIEEDGWMLWPPIRYSYDTINADLPTPSALRALLDARRGGRAATPTWRAPRIRTARSAT